MLRTAVLASLFFISGCLFAQTDSSESFTLPELKIYKKIKGEEIIYHFEKDKNKFFIQNDILTADTNKYNYKIKVNDITKVSFRNGSNVWMVAGGGAILGYFLGFMAAGFFDWDEHSGYQFHLDQALVGGLIVAVPFGLIGALAGLLSPRYDEYEFNKIKPENKKLYLTEIFKTRKFKK